MSLPRGVPRVRGLLRASQSRGQQPGASSHGVVGEDGQVEPIEGREKGREEASDVRTDQLIDCLARRILDIVWFEIGSLWVWDCSFVSVCQNTRVSF